MERSVKTQAAKSHAERIQRVTSAKGVEAWLVEDYTVPIITLEGLIEGGASQDPSGKPGVLNMLMGLLDEGAGPYDATAFQERLDDYAIEMSFGADRDHASLHLRSLARHKDEAFAMLRLALNEALLDTQSIERVRAQVLAGLRHESSDPDTMAQRRFFAEAFAGHPYAKSAKGTLQSVPEISRDDLVSAQKQVFARQHLHLVVVGAIDADHLARVLDDVFGAWPEQVTLQPVSTFVDIPRDRQIVVDFDVPQSSIRFGARGLSRNDPDFVTATVVNHILGGGVFSSRLFREVREKRGLAYSVYSHLAPFAHGPLYVGGTSTKNERVGESLSIIAAEILSLATDGPTEDELKTSKNFLIGSHALRLDTSSKLAGQLVHIKAHGLGLDYLDRRNAMIDAITLKEAARVAKRLYGDGQMLSVIVGRPEGL